MRLCILTQYFPPEMGAPQARLSELGDLLSERGWSVEALTALPNYPTGRLFPGYRPLETRVETIGRVRAVRVPLLPTRSGFARRLGSYFSFVASAMRHGPRLCVRPDLLLVETPPLFIGYAARYLSRRWSCPFVLNVSDLWPESAIRMGVVRRGLATRLAERTERSLYQRAAGVTCQADEIQDWVRARAPATPTAVITNGVDPTRFGPERSDEEARRLLGPEPGPIYLYAGLLGLAQGLDQVVDLAGSLPPEVPGRFVLVGDGPARLALEERARELPSRRLTILPSQPRERIPPLLAAADAAIVSLGLRLPGAVPSKIYEAMASALPILLIAEGEAARRVEQAGCGLVVRPRDAAGARAAVKRLADPELRRSLGAAGRRAAEQVYDRRGIADRLHAFLRERL